jgi:hypothetical protein
MGIIRSAGIGFELDQMPHERARYRYQALIYRCLILISFCRNGGHATSRHSDYHLLCRRARVRMMLACAVGT